MRKPHPDCSVCAARRRGRNRARREGKQFGRPVKIDAAKVAEYVRLRKTMTAADAAHVLGFARSGLEKARKRLEKTS